MSRLAPVCEEPVNEEDDEKEKKQKMRRNNNNKVSKRTMTWKNWVKTHFSIFSYHRSFSDLKILLSVLACPLFPISLSSNPSPSSSTSSSTPQVSSSAEYIIQHFRAATGCKKLEGGAVKNVFATGKVTMTMVEEPGSGGSSVPAMAAAAGGGGVARRGCFVIWEMVPNRWLIELVVAGQKVLAGSDGKVAWRYTPWLGSHAAKGGVRPLRRTLQGLDPVAISQVFALAHYAGEKEITGTDCFVLKLSADQPELADRSDSTAEMIKHVTFGYFSQKNGLLVYLEDSYLTRIQYPGTYPMYWETTMGSKIDDYGMVEGVMVAHSGRTTVTITRFGDNLKSGPIISRMEETWLIDDIAFNVPGLSMDSFIPPRELQTSHDLEEVGLDSQYLPVDP
ncbi:hypothetical protein Dimus_012727 [Dionaea muscipula]